MTHINIKISKAVATAEKDGIITTGMVGVPVSFMFDSWWDGLIVTAVFKGSGAPISVPLLGATETVVPWEVLKRPSTLLRIGAEGRLPDGTLVIPTTWATVGIVMSGANATDDLAKPPTPTAFDRIMSQIGNMNDLATEDKSSLVAAINEALTKGGGTVDPEAVQQIVEGYLAENPPTITETDPTVPAWAKQPEKPSYTASEVGADPSGTAAAQVAAHNTGTDTHSDIRLLIQGLTDKLNALADSDDTTLDQMSEVVAYIKSNKSLIDAITTSKVSVTDIVNDLVTNVTDKPLSAAQGVVIKTLMDALRNDKLDASELTNAINTALAQAKASGEFDGAPGKAGADGQDGITPTIGPNGNWYLSSTDTGKPSRGETGPAGSDGKDGSDGQPGRDGIDGQDGVGIQSVEQTTTSTEDGGTNVVTVTKTDGTSSTFSVKNGRRGSAGPAGANGAAGADGHTPVKGTDYFTETDRQEIAEQAAGMVSIPEKLPNPNALTFTGSVTGTYDGSEPVTVNIPSGGGSSGFRLVRDLTLTESAESVIINSDDDGNTFSLSECFINIFAKVTETGRITYIPNQYYLVGTFMTSTTTTATDYNYDFCAYSVGSEGMFFGYETKTRGAAPSAYYNAERNKNPSSYFGKITSYRIDAKFAAGTRFLLYGRDA